MKTYIIIKSKKLVMLEIETENHIYAISFKSVKQAQGFCEEVLNDIEYEVYNESYFTEEQKERHLKLKQEIGKADL